MATITEIQISQYLQDAADRHKVDIDKLMIGVVYDTLYLWVYDPGAVNEFRNVEMILLNKEEY